MTDDLTGGLDLLGDWLDAKGYGEEAGLCTRVMDHMHKQSDRIRELEAALKQCDAALTAQSTYHQDDGQWMYLIDGDTANAAQAAARAAMEGKE